MLSASSTGDCMAQEKSSAASVVTNWIEALPTQLLLYVTISVLAGLYAWWRWCQWQSRYGRAGDGHPAYVATNQTTIVKLLRRRAFTLETWAHCMLAGIIAVLLGGLYFIIYVLQQVVYVSDVDTARRYEFDTRFGVTLDRIVKGRHWLKVGEEPALAGEGPVMAAFFEDTGTGTGIYKGVVARDQGPVFVTADGGRSWNQSEFGQEHLENDERLVAGTFAKDGSHGVLFGSLGTLWATTDEGRTWSSLEPIESTHPALRGLPVAARDVTEAVIAKSLVVAKMKSGSTFIKVVSDKTSSSRQVRWQELTNLHLRAHTRPTAMALNGDAGILAVDRSLTFTASDSGVTWTQTNLELPRDEIVSLTREKGNTVIITKRGKKLIWSGRNTQWTEQELPLDGGSELRQDTREHWFHGLFRDDKLTLLVGSSGIVMKKTSNGTFTRMVSGESDLKEGVIVGAAFSGEDEVILIADNGRYFESQNGKIKLAGAIASPSAELVGGGWEQDGELRVLVDSEGKLHTWTGLQWHTSVVPATFNRRRNFQVQFDPNGEDGYLVASNGYVFMTTDYGRNWEMSVQLRLDEEEIQGGTFCTNYQGVFITDAGSVWTFDGTGEPAWTKGKLPFEPREEIYWENALAFSVDGQYGLVVGDNGSSVTITRDCGRTWTTPPRVAVSSGTWVIPNESRSRKELITDDRTQSTFWYDRDAHFVTTSGSPYEPIFVGVTGEGYIYLLRQRPDLGNWRTRSENDILTSVGGIDVERDMEAFISARSDSDGMGAPSRHPIMDSVHFRLMVARGTALIFLLFLLSLLVGVQRYTLRLSAFWNSRADAIALHPTLTGAPSVDFDALVKSLAPDTYDFGPAPGSLLGRMLRGRL